MRGTDVLTLVRGWNLSTAQRTEVPAQLPLAVCARPACREGAPRPWLPCTLRATHPPARGSVACVAGAWREETPSYTRWPDAACDIGPFDLWDDRCTCVKCSTATDIGRLGLDWGGGLRLRLIDIEMACTRAAPTPESTLL